MQGLHPALRRQKKEDSNEVSKMQCGDVNIIRRRKRRCDGRHGDGASVCLRACMCASL